MLDITVHTFQSETSSVTVISESPAFAVAANKVHVFIIGDPEQRQSFIVLNNLRVFIIGDPEQRQSFIVLNNLHVFIIGDPEQRQSFIVLNNLRNTRLYIK